MKLDKDDIKQILEVLEDMDSWRVLVDEMIRKVKSFGPTIKSLVDPLIDYSIEKRISTIKRFEKEGFTHQEAITLTLDIHQRIAASIQQANVKK